MTVENDTLPEDEDISYTRSQRKRIIEHLLKEDKNLDDPDIVKNALKALGDMDKQALSIKKLKQDDKNAIRADNVVAQSIMAVREFTRQQFHPFKRDSSGNMVTSSDALPEASKPITSGLKEEVQLTGLENYESFEKRMSEVEEE